MLKAFCSSESGREPTVVNSSPNCCLVVVIGQGAFRTCIVYDLLP